METLETSTAHNGQEKSTSSQEDSPASLFPQQDEGEERKTTAFSGLKCYELYEKLNLHGSSLRTFAASLLSTTAWYSSVCALSWKKMNTKSNRFVFQLAPSMRRTKGKESGLLPTCRTSSANGESAAEVAAGNPKKRLETEIAMLPTPRANKIDGKTSKGYGNTTQETLGERTGYKLQPAFAAWMMGFPENWTELPFQSGAEKASKPTETP